MIQGISEAPQSVSFAAMAERQQALADAMLQDPGGRSLSSFIGVDGTNTTLNSGRMLINLKPLAERDARAQSRSSAACSRAAPSVPGITLYLQPVQDLTIDDRVSRTQYQFTLEDADPDDAGRLGAASWSTRCAQLPRAAPTSPATCRTRACRPTSTSTATPPARLGITAGDDRQRALRRLRPAPHLDHLHPVEPVPRDPRGAARTSAPDRRRWTTSTCPPPAAAQVPLVAIATHRASSPRRWRSTTSASFPAATISFNLAPGVSLGDAVDAIQRRGAGDRHAGRGAAPASRAPRSRSRRRWPTSCC